MKKKWSVLLAVFLFGLLLVSCSSRPEPDERATAFIEGLIEGQHGEIYDMLTVEAKNRISKTEFINRYQIIYDRIGIVSLDLDLVTPPEGEKWPIKDNQVAIPIEGEMFTWTVDSINMNQTLHMKYVEKEWKIDWQPSNILPQLKNLTEEVIVTREDVSRGRIYDRMGRELVGPGKIYSIGLVPGKMGDWDTTISRMAELLSLTPEKVEKALKQKWVRPDLFVPLRSITSMEWEVKKEALMAVSGMLASTRTGRTYTAPQSLAPTLGYLGEINAEELAKWKNKGYILGDLTGRVGLEKAYETYLRGKPGYMIRIVDENGRETAMVKFTRSMPGNDLYLTIDRHLQQIIEDKMGERYGAAVALTPGTGEILALVSLPGYDANEFLLGGSSSKIRQLLNDPATPLLNRPIQGLYIPGSTFKPLTTLAALELYPEYDPGETVELPEDTWRAEPSWGGYRVRRVPRPAGPVDLYDAMKWSDNIYFAQLAYRMGGEPLFKMADRVGFDEKVPFVLDVAQSTLASQRPFPNSILLADTGYGQGQVQITPLQLAMIYGAIATDGNLLTPVISTNEPTGKVWKEKIATSENLGIVQDALTVTVQDPTTSAHAVDLPDLNLAGKTGTAQVNTTQKENMAWFICYQPAISPEFLLLVGLEDTDSSKEAVKLAREILAEYYQIQL